MSRSSCRATPTPFVAVAKCGRSGSFRATLAEPGRWQDEVDGCDAVVNLAGHNIFAERWNTEIKRKLRDSRVHSAEQLSNAIKQAHERPAAFIHGSAVGYYGARGDEELDESGTSGSDLLAVICREAEEASAGLEAAGRQASAGANRDRAGAECRGAQGHDAAVQDGPGSADRRRRQGSWPRATSG